MLEDKIVELVAGVLAALLGAILWRIYWGRPISEEERQKMVLEFQQRLRNPALQELQEHFGVLPRDLVALYQQQDLVLRREFVLMGKEEHYIRSFLPADRKTLSRFTE